MPFLPVDKLKNGQEVKLYYTVCGNPNGIPVVYLHGGPGDAITPSFKRQYDLKIYRLLLYDQRGCGKSLPHNHVEKNTTQLLLQDIEELRKVMGVEKWLITGGSWGSALAILYAEKWPARVLGLILRGVYDLNLDTSVIQSVYPEQDDVIDKIIPTKSSREYFKKSKKILLGKRTNTRRKLINALNQNDPLYVYDKPGKDTFAVKETLAIIGNHYEANHFFMPTKAIYSNLHKIIHLPVLMLEGRYDVVTPMNIAYTLHKKLPKSELRIVRSGHTMHEHAMMKALCKASRDMAVMLRTQR
jgi:proline iminopeptidase